MTRSSSFEVHFANRRKKVIKQIKGEAALFFAAPQLILSRDQEAHFRQNSDFLYLTGMEEPESALLLLGTSSGPRSVMFLRDRNPSLERWQGERIGLKRARRRFQVDEVRDIAQFEKDFPQLVHDCQVLHFAPGCHPKFDQLIWEHFQSTVGPRATFPNTLRDARLITSEMRVVKDREEIRTLRHVADITAHAFALLAPQIKSVSSEAHAARVLEGHFAKLGGHGLAFDTIVAAGRNATSLHHRPLLQPLWKRELVLIDAGAAYRGYAADISRTFPVSGHFNPVQASVYDVVLSAMQAAIKRVKPGVTLEQVHDTAVAEMAAGLVDLKALKGSAANAITGGQYKKFFMHRIGHFLGLDVHDTSPIHFPKPLHAATSWNKPLVAGNVITIEPGLYFDLKDSTVPKRLRGIGIRIEDDILVTESGSEVLTSKLPTSRADIEALMT